MPKQELHTNPVNMGMPRCHCQQVILSAGSWDHLAPLFKPPPRADAKPIPVEPPNEAAAADVLFAAVQNKRYTHTKGVSYKGATFALVPLDRKVGQFFLLQMSALCLDVFQLQGMPDVPCLVSTLCLGALESSNM